MSESQKVDTVQKVLATRLATKRGDALIAAIAEEFARLLGRVDQLESALRAHDLAASFQENAVIGATVPARIARVRNLVILPETSLDPSVQLHKLEYMTNGKGYRWTGPGRSLRFLLPLDRSGALISTLSLMHVPEASRRLPIIMKVDGAEVARLETPEQVLSVELPLRDAAQDRAFTEIEFEVAETLVPNSEDLRKIGFGFISLRISEA